MKAEWLLLATARNYDTCEQVSLHKRRKLLCEERIIDRFAETCGLNKKLEI